MYRWIDRREERSIIFRYIELELFGLLHVRSYMSNHLGLARDAEMRRDEITDTCFQVRCKRNQTGTASVSS
jgi:hypothetical protein